MSTIGEKIRLHRKATKMTQAQLAGIVGISRVTVTQYESGAITPPIDKLEKLAAALGCSVFDLIDRAEIDTATPEQKNALADIAGNEADAQLKKAFYCCELAGYKWEWENHAPGMIHLVDKRTGTKYAVTDEAFTAAVDGSAQFIDFNFAKLIENAKIID